MLHIHLSRNSGWSIMALAFTAALSTQLSAQERPATASAQDSVQDQASAGQNPELKLGKFVVSATRSPQDPATMPSSVTEVNIGDLQARQINDLSSALSAVPGLAIVNTGAPGGVTSIFSRGSNSHQTLFVVDGVRMNDRSASYANFLGSADLGGLDRIEVLRGPQGTLYGSSAMGGVILMETARGCGAPTGSVSASAGSFETYAGQASVKGGVRNFGYSASIGRFSTANDRDFNAYDSWTYSTRLEGTPSEDLLVGVTVRGQQVDSEAPGSTLYASLGVVDADNHLVTGYAQLKTDSNLTSRVTAAWHNREYAFTTQWGVSPNENTRRILDWQNTWAACKRAEIVAGFNYEDSEYKISNLTNEDVVSAGYLTASLKPMKNLSANIGVRYDDYDSFGDATTWRAGAAYFFAGSGTKLRATYGTGFSAPGSDDRYGVPSWGMLANPAIQPEKSRGYDVGFDQSLFNNSLNLSVTYFHNRFTNLFEWVTTNFTTFEGRTENRSRATTQGVETAIEVRLGAGVTSRVSYTYTDSRNDDNGRRLNRRPLHVGDADVRYQINKAWLVGTGLHIAAGRIDGVALTEDYTTVRVFGSWKPADRWTIKARVENALDEEYAEVRGYPALPVGGYASVEWTF